jgi:hypothetical protein
VLVIIAGGVVVYIGAAINRQVGKAKQLYKQIQSVTDETMHTPRTLSGSEGLMLTRLSKDFPEFNADVARQIVSGALTNYFAILNSRSGTSRLESSCTDAFISELEGILMTDATVYNNVKVHRVVISDYRKTGEEAVITYQAAVEYERNQKALAQFVYEIKYVYYLSEDSDGENASLVCQYCGAPISTLGEKVCEFCGAEIKASVERTWKINKIYKAR